MDREYPFLEITKPDRTQYTIELEKIIKKQKTTEIHISTRKILKLLSNVFLSSIDRPENLCCC
jgi:hypothetical protein